METVSLDDMDFADMLPAPRLGPGRQAAPLHVEYVRDLTPADLAMPATEVQKPSAIKTIRDSHHSVARMLATGSKEFEIAAATGYSPGRISVLKADPQFQELVNFYRSDTEKAVTDFRARMLGLGVDALNELQERLDTQPEEFSPALLKDIVKDLADRTGHAPQRGPTAVTQINVTLTERMAAARERIKNQLGRDPVIDV